MFMISTSLVLLLKREEASSEDIDDMGIVDAYRLLWKIVQRPAVVTMCAVLLTAKVGQLMFLVHIFNLCRLALPQPMALLDLSW